MNTLMRSNGRAPAVRQDAILKAVHAVVLNQFRYIQDALGARWDEFQHCNGKVFEFGTREPAKITLRELYARSEFEP